jgi:hypothetical protein
MTKKNESLRGIHDLYVLLVVSEFGRPAKESEIEEKTNFPMTSIVLSFMAKRGYVDHDEDAHTWCITDAGRAHLLEVAQRETREYYSWKESQS